MDWDDWEWELWWTWPWACWNPEWLRGTMSRSRCHRYTQSPSGWACPVLVVKAVFHSSSILIRMRLKALHKSSLVKHLAVQSCSRATGTKGSGYLNLIVISFRPLQSIQGHKNICCILCHKACKELIWTGIWGNSLYPSMLSVSLSKSKLSIPGVCGHWMKQNCIFSVWEWQSIRSILLFG